MRRASAARGAIKSAGVKNIVLNSPARRLLAIGIKKIALARKKMVEILNRVWYIDTNTTRTNKKPMNERHLK